MQGQQQEGGALDFMRLPINSLYGERNCPETQGPSFPTQTLKGSGPLRGKLGTESDASEILGRIGNPISAVDCGVTAHRCRLGLV